MTETEISALKEYFKRDLPKTFQMPGATIIDCRMFVESQFMGIGQGAQLIKRTCFDRLLRFKEALDCK